MGCDGWSSTGGRLYRPFQFLREEGVSSGAGLDILHSGLRQMRNMRDNGANLLVAQWLELDCFDGIFALQVGQEESQGVAARQFVLAARANDNHGKAIQTAGDVD